MHEERPIPGLAREMADSGDWLFRWRSYPPVVILGLLLGATALDPAPFGGWEWTSTWVGAGMALGVFGLGVRGWAIGFVPTGTSGRGTRAMRAASLNTQGLYSAVRHPLYLGNLLMWIGVAAVTGAPSLILVTGLLFRLYYERIMLAEERFLSRRFGVEFEAWAKRTPAFWPSFRRWIPSKFPFSLRFLLGRDYHAFYAFVISTFLVAVVASGAGTGSWIPGRPWLYYLASGTLIFCLLHLLRHHTRLLTATDR